MSGMSWIERFNSHLELRKNSEIFSELFFPHIIILFNIDCHTSFFFHFGVREFDFSLILFLCSVWF